MRGSVRRRHRGQALVELAIALPVLVVLLAGGAQFGAIVWGNVSADSAAHEAAVSGAAAPFNSLTKAVNEGATPGVDGHGAYTYQCKAYQSSYSSVESDPICITAYDAAGALVQSSMTVQIYAPPSSAGGGVSLALPPGDVVQVDNNGNGDGNGNGNTNTCSSNYEQVSGTVPTLPNSGQASVTSWNGAQTTTSSLSYVLCVKPSSGAVEPLGAAYNDSSTGCTYSASYPSNFIPTNNGTLTWSPSSWTVNCPTTSTTSTSTSTGTSSSTSTSSTSSTTSTVSTSSVSAPTCTSNSPAPYFSVTVSYSVPIFVPFVGGLLSSGGGSSRTVKETVWMEADPCGVTQGN